MFLFLLFIASSLVLSNVHFFIPEMSDGFTSHIVQLVSSDLSF
jgi:hypothetical protein